MEKPPQPRKRRSPPYILGAVVFILLVLLFLLNSSNLWRNLTVETASDTLLLYALSSLNFLAFIIFGFIFIRSLLKLSRERRALELGSKIKTRLLIFFIAVSLLPIIAMAVFSYLFMNRALDRWFTQIPENVVREAKEVHKQSNIDQSGKLQEIARMLAILLDKQNAGDADLRQILEAGNLTRMEIVSAENKTIVAAQKPLDDAQKKELENALALINQTDEPLLRDGKGFDAATANFSDGRKLIVVVRYPAQENVNQLFDRSLAVFDQLKEKQLTVRQIGFLTLGVLTFLLIFASSWTAFYIARGLTVPIKALAEGADEIAQGNLNHRVDVLAEDELALLVSAFNQMSAKLEENSAELEERRKYTETVLQSLSTGVVSLDADNHVTTINKAAVQILRLDDADFAKIELSKLVTEENRVVLERLLNRAKRIGQASEQTILQREQTNGATETSGNLPVALTATALPRNFGEAGGVVLVIEDLSELLEAQRASAWQEVARRMAHEIKNPLTPIQLSAERIAKKFSGQLSVVSGQLEEENSNRQLATDHRQLTKIVRDGTETILREVNSLKVMVDEFSRFARLPNVRLEGGNLNEIVRQTVDLYEDRFANLRIEARFDENLPNVMLDAEQLKRVFVNLIDNAIEAFEKTQEDRQIFIKTFHDAARDLVVAEVSDNGNGISPSDFQKLFQPYFSTKNRGTGLGLAIVQRIVSEHHGRIKTVSNQPKGAKFIIELPVGV